MKHLLTAGAALTLLTACDGTSVTRDAFMTTAGAQIQSSDFGNATMNNHLIQTGQVNYTVNLQNRFAAEVQDTITFEFNSATLTPQGRQVLTQQASWIRQFPEVRFKVFGHTDLVGSNAYNRRLGMRRARAAVNYLISQGIERDRLEAVVTFGETRPLVQTQNPEMRNRRTVTEVSGFVQRHPTVMDGKYAAIIYRDYIASGVPASNLSTLSSSEIGSAEGN